MESNHVLEYGDIPQVAMDAMNVIHSDELNIVNQVNAAIVANNTEKISILCQEWLVHTKAHFERENGMMEKYNFPAYHCHYGEHTDALNSLESAISAWESRHNPDDLAVYVRDIWPKWYVNHISTMDIVTSAFIKQSIENE